MPYNGSGVFTRIYNWVNDAAAAIDITASRVDGEDDGFAAGLTNCICKDGQTTVTANLPMATFRHTGVGNGVARTDYAALGQVQDGTPSWVAGGGTADAITASYSPVITALVDGMVLRARASGANTITTPSFSPNGLTAHTITKRGGVALVAGDIPAALYEMFLVYNLANTRWELLNPNPLSGPASATSGNVATFNGTSGANVQDGGTALSALALSARNLTAAGLVTGGGTLAADRTFTVTAATKSDMQTATSSTTAVTPAQAQNHPGAAKAWVNFTVSGTTPTVKDSYNVTSVARQGVGIYRVTFTTSFANTNYGYVATAGLNTAGTFAMVCNLADTPNKNTGSCDFEFRKITNAVDEPADVTIGFYGAQ
jgi:hypothetical protein